MLGNYLCNIAQYDGYVYPINIIDTHQVVNICTVLCEALSKAGKWRIAVRMYGVS